MLRAYVTAKSARLILAMLLFGSVSGFVLGQEMHHPSATHKVSVVTASAAGSLGTAGAASRLAASTSHTQSASVPRSHTPTHHKNHHHQGDATDDGGAITVSADSLGSVHTNHDSGDSSHGGGDH